MISKTTYHAIEEEFVKLAFLLWPGILELLLIPLVNLLDRTNIPGVYRVILGTRMN